MSALALSVGKAGARRPPDDFDFQRRLNLSSEDPIGRAPRVRVLACGRVDIGHRRRCSVAADGGGLDEPAIAVGRPKRLAVSPFGIEKPRLDLLREWVPADALAEVHDVVPPLANRDVLQDKIFVFTPLT